MFFLRRYPGICCVCALIVALGAVTWIDAQSTSPAVAPDVKRAIVAFRTHPAVTTELNYIMTGRVRLLLFWTGKDDVGAARVRRGASDGLEWIDLLAGSDPRKAPRAINRWGSAAEFFGRTPRGVQNSTFFGFMKVSKGTSTAEMEQELAHEKENGEFLFSAIVDRSGGDTEFVKVLPFTSDTDYTIHDVDRATPSVLSRMEGPQGVIKSLAPDRRGCERAAGFLSTVSELIDNAMESPRQKRSLCYSYNGQRRTLTLVRATPVREQKISLSLTNEPQRYQRTYHDLLQVEMENENEETGKSSSFRLLLGTQGEIKGLPVQISYQPNWWFQVVLNLKTSESLKASF